MNISFTFVSRLRLQAKDAILQLIFLVVAYGPVIDRESRVNIGRIFGSATFKTRVNPPLPILVNL